jgi:general secretion pathway protein K
MPGYKTASNNNSLGAVDRRAFVLIMALWALAFLTVLALSVGMGTRQKIIMLGRLEDRSQAQFAAEAGVKKAVAVLLDDLENNLSLYSPEAKVRRHNNPEFSVIELAGKKVEVVCKFPDDRSNRVIERYGLCDEHSKININTADAGTLTRLIAQVLPLDPDGSRLLAAAIIDWRDYGKREATGFFSDDYYKNLEFPYDMKEHPFERIDELLLVKGMNNISYESLRPFITIYGDGKINVNTVSRRVLIVLGLDEAVADKLLKSRRGQDDQEATPDDHIFLKTFDIPAEVNSFISLEENEMRQLDALNAADIFSTDSNIFGFTSRVLSGSEDPLRRIEIVFDAMKNKYEYWFEK